MMEFSATFKSMLELTLALSFLSLGSILSGYYGHSFGMLVLGIALFALLLLIRTRFKVKFDEHTLSSTGFFSTKTLKWSDIKQVIRMVDCGYPKNRFYGPFVYEFQTLDNHLKINFKLFPVECESKILKKARR